MQGGLNTRQWILKNWLLNNFVPGKFYSIEEIVEALYYEGKPLYELNKNPKIHDKCIKLAEDIKTINWNIREGYKIIVKDSKGGAKICESMEEFNEWYDNEMKPLVKKIEYLNTLKGKAKLDGTCPIINKADNPIEPEKVKPIDVFETIGIFDCLDE